MSDPSSDRPFTLMLASGGARGYAHAGVLRALEAEGFRPDAVVGVSMGAVIGATYALRTDWYDAILGVDTSPFPDRLPTHEDWEGSSWQWMRAAGTYVRLTYESTFGWGVGNRSYSQTTQTLRTLTRERNLEEGRIPVAVCATDLQTGSREVFQSGAAAEAAYASAAIPGIFPPGRQGDRLLVDGAYSDIAPVDVARDFEPPLVIAVDPTQPLAPKEVKNGFQAMLRAVEICQMRHADLRFDDADLVLKPPFRRTIDTLDFDARRECVAAGLRAVRERRDDLYRLLQSDSEVAHSSPDS
jgi:NTE family protein